LLFKRPVRPERVLVVLQSSESAQNSSTTTTTTNNRRPKNFTSAEKQGHSGCHLLDFEEKKKFVEKAHARHEGFGKKIF